MATLIGVVCDERIGWCDRTERPACDGEVSIALCWLSDAPSAPGGRASLFWTGLTAGCIVDDLSVDRVAPQAARVLL